MPTKSTTSIDPSRGALQHGAAVTQPHDGSVIDAVGWLLRLGDWFRMCVGAGKTTSRRRSLVPWPIRH